jgi:penicillin-binding protein 1B
LEVRYGKDAILEAYLNEVYLGQIGPVAISGVGDASRFFFATPVTGLDLPRSALLSGMIRNPGGYDPRRQPDRARARRDLVLELMRDRGAIDGPAFEAAVAAPLGVVSAPAAADRLPWVEAYLARELEPIAREIDLSSAGCSIFTTFDEQVQRAARAALEAGLDTLESRLGRDGRDPLEGAVVVIRPADGGLLAVVGGRDYGRSQYNRATQALRPPGSTFKPFVYLAGFERSLRDPDFELTAASLLDDEPMQLVSGGKTWSPANYDRRFRGQVTVREALEQSINVPTVRAAMAVGVPEVAEMARRCGISRDLDAVPSLALGAEEVTPVELATAYATIASGGWRGQPHGLLSVIDRDGDRHGRSAIGSIQVIEPELAYLVTDILEGVVERGTARGARTLGFSGAAAGKTGSSDGLRDAWFVGYTPEVLALVWVGTDGNRPIGLSGAEAALPIWVDLMQRIGATGAGEFRRPAGIVEARIDPSTAQLATSRCPDSRSEVFVRGTEPDTRCQLHEETARKGFWKRLFGRRKG